MKKICIAFLIVLMAVGGVEAGGQKGKRTSSRQSSYGIIKANCGCGLGSRWMRNSKSALAHWLALYLNGITGQVYGITSGTQDCKQAPSFAFNEKLEIFVADNMDNLAKDIAMGRGETLDALAELLEIPGEERGDFSETLQAHFSDIFTSPDVTSADVIQSILVAWDQG
jgi:hypothetical protein